MGWYRDAGIDLKIVEPTDAGAEQAVGQGKAAFGISMAEGVLPARAQKIPVVSIGAILPVNDSSLMSLASEGITEPKDLQGKVYGGYNGPLETELINRLAKCGGIDPSSVKHVEVGNVDYLAGLEANRFDVVWIFSGWDALRLRRGAQGDRPDPLLGSLRLHPELVHAVVHHQREDDQGATRAGEEVHGRHRGYQLAIDDPQRAADLMLKAVPRWTRS
jgi:ABC-type nitrate/sulfonate/bicarbonate transport system substrate-binding protein